MIARISPCACRGIIFLGRGTFSGFLCLATLIGSIQTIYTALKNREPLVITCKDFIEKKPSTEWLTLTEASISVVESAYSTSGGKADELYIPVRPFRESLDKPVHILLISKDKDLLKDVAGAKADRDKGPKGVSPVWKHLDKMFKSQQVSGLIKFGVSADGKTREKLQKLHMNLTSDFVLIKEGDAPSLGGGFFLLFVSILLGLFAMWRASGSVIPLPPGPPPLPPAPITKKWEPPSSAPH